jgi:hypothetical protein
MIGPVTLQRWLIALCCLAAAGCAQVADEAPKDAATAEEAAIADEAATAVEPAAIATASSMAADAGTADSAPLAPADPLADGTQSSIDEPSAVTDQLPPPSVASADLPPAVLEQPVVPAAPATREPERASDLIASSAASPPAAETLDFTSLATRLRKTKAVNLRTKFTVKNETDDLLEGLRAYHAQRGTATLAELRRSYDALILKLYSLLEDADPPLARDIERSRAAIWAILADPMKFRASARTASTRSVPPA